MRELAATLTFSTSELAMVATAVSELARNILMYAGEGRITLDLIESSGRQGVAVVAEDQGPGIQSIEIVMQDGFSTSNGLGLGLPGSRRLMDVFTIDSSPGAGTTITAEKWARH